jgi:hypothetical protein
MKEEEDFKEFELLVRPLMEYLDTKHHPHVTIIITSTNAELVEGLMGVTNNEN